MTDFERLVVAWELCRRRGSALARGPGAGPFLLGAMAGGCVIGAAALKPLVGS